MGAKDRGSPQSTITISRCSPRRDGYYLECRKDAQCDCSMCKASISATLDLRPGTSNSRFGSVITNKVRSSPSMPESSTSKTSGKENRPWPLPTHSPPRNRNIHHLRRITQSHQIRLLKDSQLRRKWLLATLFILAFLIIGSAWPWTISFLFRAYLRHDSFKNMAENSFVRVRLVDRLDFVQRQVGRMSRSKSVSNCTGSDSVWKISEDEHFVHSTCDVYGSASEKVSLWGYAPKTGGILGRSLVDRSFTVLAGKVLEWKEGGLEYVVHPEGSSWTMRRWSASTLVLDGNTWVLEYKRTCLSEGFGGISELLYVAKGVAFKYWRNTKLSIDTAFFVPWQGLRSFSHMHSSNRIRPT